METMMRVSQPLSFPRWMVVAMYAAPPVGLAVYLLGTKSAALAGLAISAISLAFMVRLWRSPYWRPGNHPDARLDERELAIRNRAYQRAYTLIASAVLLALIYLQLAFDRRDAVRFWLPSSYEEASRLFWTAFVYTATLPAAILAWWREAFD